MKDYILLVGIPALLESQGPGHKPANVRFCADGIFAKPEWQVDQRVMGDASPLWWDGEPVYPAIDALVREINLRKNKEMTATGKWQRDEVLMLARVGVLSFGGSVIDSEAK
ncbi:MAG: hypothetical protein WC911_01730 [Thermoleophilia bacterium]